MFQNFGIMIPFWIGTDLEVNPRLIYNSSNVINQKIVNLRFLFLEVRWNRSWPPRLITWHHTTGSWTYAGSGFNRDTPNLIFYSKYMFNLQINIVLISYHNKNWSGKIFENFFDRWKFKFEFENVTVRISKKFSRSRFEIHRRRLKRII